MYAFHLSTWEAEAGDLCKFKASLVQKEFQDNQDYIKKKKSCISKNQKKGRQGEKER